MPTDGGAPAAQLLCQLHTTSVPLHQHQLTIPIGDTNAYSTFHNKRGGDTNRSDRNLATPPRGRQQRPKCAPRRGGADNVAFALSQICVIQSVTFHVPPRPFLPYLGGFTMYSYSRQIGQSSCSGPSVRPFSNPRAFLTWVSQRSFWLQGQGCGIPWSVRPWLSLAPSASSKAC